MFRQSTLQGIGVVLLLALLARQELLALVCALVLFTAGVAMLWNRWALARVQFEHTLSQTRAFPGDELELRIRIDNRKPLPLARLHVRESIPAGLQIEGPDIYSDRDGRHMIQRTTSMRWYEGVIWRYSVRCTKRGAFRLNATQLTAGDPFGFYQTISDIAHPTSVLVYPRMLPLQTLGLPARNPLGALRARHLITDPMRTVGVRDYTPRDPIKDVHWLATARTGTLQTRIYEATTTRELAIFLDIDSFEEYWQGMDEAQIERLISAAATMVQASLAEGYAVGLYVNGAPAELAQIPPGRGPAQLERIMETLARLVPYSVTSISHVIRATASRVPWGATLLLISAIAPEKTQVALSRLHARGRSVVWLYMGEDAPPQVAGIAVHHAPPQGDWRKGHS